MIQSLEYCSEATVLGDGLEGWLLSKGFAPGSSKHIRAAAAFNKVWKEDSRPVLSLTHSIAALLAATKSQPISVNARDLPFPTFVVEIPSEFVRMPSFDEPTTLVALGADDADGDCGSWVSGIFTRQRAGVWIAGRVADGINFDESHLLTSRPAVVDESRLFAIRQAVRIVCNTVSFVSTHRDCVGGKTFRRRAQGENFQIVRAPRDVEVSREFRQSIVDLVAARDVPSARRALAHIVRGHWRNQPVGEGRKERKLTWVRPHKRGDESLGRVVSRIERITAKEST